MNVIQAARRFPRMVVVLWIGIVLGSCLSDAFDRITIVSYNVGNLFDDVDDGSEYRRFDPANGEWGSEQFHAKLERIAEALRIADPDLPDVVILQEVENRNAIEQLGRLYIDDGGYTAVMATVEGSAIQVAILSRPAVVSARSHEVYGAARDHPLRNVLEVELAVGDDRLILFANHWKSKLGGAEETEADRRASAGLVAWRIRTILRSNPAAKIVVAGDLNESPDEYLSVKRRYLTALMPADLPEADMPPGAERSEMLFVADLPPTRSLLDGRVVLWDPWSEAEETGEGSYWYASAESWERIDNLLLSSGLFDGEGYLFEEFRVINDEALLDSRGHPRAFDSEHASGFSDHLPIMVVLRLSIGEW